VRKAVGHSIPDYLYDPPKLAGFCNGHLPCPRSEILSADRSILCHEIWLTTWLEVDCHEVTTRLSDNYIVAIHYDSQVTIKHGLRVYPAKMASKGTMSVGSCDSASRVRNLTNRLLGPFDAQPSTPAPKTSPVAGHHSGQCRLWRIASAHRHLCGRSLISRFEVATPQCRGRSLVQH